MNTFRTGTGRIRSRRAAVCALALGAIASAASASTVNHQYTALGGNSWAVDFSLLNDGAQPAMAGFTVYFAPDLFTNLTIAATPAGWDSIVIQPDLGLPAPGFFDTTVLTPAALPAVGQALDGFRVTFNWSGTGTDPGRLRYTLNDVNFNELADGLTVPEPASALLVALGLGAAGLARRRETRDDTASDLPVEHASEVTA